MFSLTQNHSHTLPRREKCGALRRLARSNANVEVNTTPPHALERAVAKPVNVSKQDQARLQAAAWTNDHLAARSIEANNVQWLGIGNPEPAPLADREVDNALVLAEHAAIDVHDAPAPTASGRRRSMTSV